MIKHLFVVLLVLTLACEKKPESHDKNTKPLVCSTMLDDSDSYQTVFANTDKVDISSIANVVLYNDDLVFTQPYKGNVVLYNMKEQSFQQIGRVGRGPFEFQNAWLYNKENMLYIYDYALTKITEYDLEKGAFIKEHSLDKVIPGLIIHAEDVNDTTYLYFNVERRDRTVSNDTFTEIIKYNPITRSEKTLLSFQNLGTLSYWDSSAKYDFVSSALMYSHTQVGELGGALVSVNTGELSFDYIGSEKENYVIDYNYAPKYESHIQSMYDNIDAYDRNFPEKTKKMLRTAMKLDGREFSAVFSNWISSRSHILLSLFSDKNAYLIHPIDKKESNQVVCTNENFKPIAIGEEYIYWVVEREGYEYELIKTKI